VGVFVNNLEKDDVFFKKNIVFLSQSLKSMYLCIRFRAKKQRGAHEEGVL
jgi:hypothetical protein